MEMFSYCTIAVLFALLTAQCPDPPVPTVQELEFFYQLNCWRPGVRRPEEQRIASLAKLTAISQVMPCVPIVPCGLTLSKGEAISFSSNICMLIKLNKYGQKGQNFRIRIGKNMCI